MQDILVTGSHRSGSTWVGEVLSQRGDYQYIHEPFNLLNKEYFETPLNYWFEYVGNNPSRKEVFAEYVKNFYRPNPRFYINKGIYKAVTTYPPMKSLFLSKKKAKIIKDPIALFSANFFHETLGFKILVTIRHPAAFVNSLIQTKWSHDFSHFTNQIDLMNRLPENLRSEIEKMSQNGHTDIADQGILLWNLTHWQIFQYQKEFKDWIFLKHEDLSADPIVKFKEICSQLGLPYTEKMEAYVLKSSTASGTKGKNRDSRQNIKKWARTMDHSLIAKIRTKTENFAQPFYQEADWN